MQALVVKTNLRNPWNRLRPLPPAPLVVHRRYLIEVPSTLLAAPLVARRNIYVILFVGEGGMH